jgi:MFS superfamily sulfate permease-like transporter
MFYLFNIKIITYINRKNYMKAKKYNFKILKQDIFGGITAAVVALPLGLAFGISSGLGALTGLYGAIIVGFFASLFGGTPKQISNRADDSYSCFNIY